MGVAVLTLAGQRHASRAGLSILHQVGLTDWTAGDETDYVERAVAFAKNPSAPGKLRRGMRKPLSSSSLLAKVKFPASIEMAYLEMLKTNKR